MKKVSIPKQSISGKNIYLIVSAAKKMRVVPEVADELLAKGANVFIIPTENALKMPDYLSKYRHLIYSDFNWRGNGKQLPEEDIIMILPCTFNTFNKISSGIADNYATTLIATAIGNSKKVYIAPAFDKTLWNHPQTVESVKKLESWGATVIWPEITSKKVSMMDYRKALDRLYIEESTIIFDSEQIFTDELLDLLKTARKRYIQEFVKIGKYQEQVGLNAFSNGNYSVKLENQKLMLITRTGSSLGNLSPEDLTLVSLENMNKVVWVGDKMPSCDTPMHIVIYNNTNARAITHSHCSRITYDETLDKHKTADYIRYGRVVIILSAIDQLERNNGIIILRYHGEVGIGQTLDEASRKITKLLEQVGKINKNG